MTRQTENQAFVCAHCGASVPEHAWGSYRNHCPWCLRSLHVDNVPGDRAAGCGGVMDPVGVDHSGKKGFVLIHRCTVCAGTDRNKTAPDDDVAAVAAVAGRTPPPV